MDTPVGELIYEIDFIFDNDLKYLPFIKVDIEVPAEKAAEAIRSFDLFPDVPLASPPKRRLTVMPGTQRTDALKAQIETYTSSWDLRKRK